ncbi:hypothetical protein [Sphingobium ummariense]|nr:hypothetical protein [Sphingobium ummariense]
MDGSIWTLVTIGGPVLLAGVLIFVILSNRRHRNPREVAQTEAATRELRRDLNAEDTAGDREPH